MNDTKQVIFKVGGEEYGLDIMLVNAIEKYTNVIKVPNSPECIKGIINLRGDVIPVFSLRKKFGLPEIPVTENTKLIVTKSKGLLLAYEVDVVQEIVEISGDKISEAPVIVKSDETNYIGSVANIDGHLIILLDQDGIISASEKEKIQEIIQ